jgi:hypothetical protein
MTRPSSKTGRSLRYRVSLLLLGLRKPRTASELLTLLNSESPGPRAVLASLSGVLARASRPGSGDFVRVPQTGPRGGYGYKLSPTASKQIRKELAQKLSEQRSKPAIADA